MSTVQQAYDSWAAQYDSNLNRTRDLEAVSLRETLQPISFHQVLEIGCGTGKNTEWLVTRAQQVTAVDLSTEMLARASAKLTTDKVRLVQADILQPWSFAVDQPYDLVTFSLVLEHIESIDPIFARLQQVVSAGGHVYIGELHPFKQYLGTKARFDTSEGRQEVTCFNHHVSDFTEAARKHGFGIVSLREYFDADPAQPPRILTLLLQKKTH